MSDLARVLLGAGRPGTGTQLVMSGDLLTLDTATGANTVAVGTANYVNLPVVNLAALTTGRVLLLNTAAGPIVLGRLTQAP